jgi:hypothetical protein
MVVEAISTWWAVQLADTLDPITLDPLGELPYPPFELRANVDAQARSSDYFDGRALAMYLVARHHFVHPISRRPISRNECVALDAHLKRNRVCSGISETVRHFDAQRLRVEQPGAAQSEDIELARAEQAEALRRRLFVHARAPAPPSSTSRERVVARNVGPTRSARAAARAAAAAAASGAAVERSGGLAIFDDDQLPSHAPSLHHTPVISLADFGDWPTSGIHRPVSFPALSTAGAVFPALPSEGAPRPLLAGRTLPPELVAAAERRADEKRAAAARAAEAAAAARLHARATKAAARAQRAAELSSEAHSALVSVAAAQFSVAALQLPTTAPELAAELEETFDLFVAAPHERRRALRPMPKHHRRLVHELAHLYHIGTLAAGVEPKRFINLLRTERTGWPECTLLEAAELAKQRQEAASELAKQRQEGAPRPAATTQSDAALATATAAAAVAMALKIVEPAGAVNEAPPFLSGVPAPTHTNGSTLTTPTQPADFPAPPAPAAEWCISLYQIECSEAALTARLRSCTKEHTGPCAVSGPFTGSVASYRLIYDPERRSDRAAARESARLRARLYLPSAAAARAVLDALGGGLRGQFRVERPPWAAASSAANDAEVNAAGAKPAVGGTVSERSKAQRQRQRQQQRQPRDGGALDWSEDAQRLMAQLICMGFARHAAARASEHVLEARGGSEAVEELLARALDYLMTDPVAAGEEAEESEEAEEAGEADEEKVGPAKAVGKVKEGPAKAEVASSSYRSNPWSALEDEGDDD